MLTTLTAITKAALEAVESAKAESLGFVRLLFTGIFGVVVGQGVVPLGLKWWWSALIATVLMLILLFGSQWSAKHLGSTKFVTFLAKSSITLGSDKSNFCAV